MRQITSSGTNSLNHRVWAHGRPDGIVGTDRGNEAIWTMSNLKASARGAGDDEVAR
jgi:hypothetical protein